MQSVAMATSDPSPVSARPQPVAVSYPSGPSSGGDDGRVSSGSTTGAVLGSILGAVIRGGVVGDVDECDPRTDGRHATYLRSRSVDGSQSAAGSAAASVAGRVGGSTRGGVRIGGISVGRIASR